MKLKNYLLTEQHSYTSFAKIVGVSRVTVMKWAKGRVMPRPLHVAAIVKATQGQVLLQDHYEAFVKSHKDLSA
jgi:DNA-binding transcriptional regulator YdaS (Cro superfamily)